MEKNVDTRIIGLGFEKIGYLDSTLVTVAMPVKHRLKKTVDLFEQLLDFVGALVQALRFLFKCLIALGLRTSPKRNIALIERARRRGFVMPFCRALELGWILHDDLAQ